jgi:hypothetical protein
MEAWKELNFCGLVGSTLWGIELEVEQGSERGYRVDREELEGGKRNLHMEEN